VAFEDTGVLRRGNEAVVTWICTGLTLNKAAAFVKGTLLSDGKDVIFGVQLPDLAHLLNVDLVERVFQRNGPCLAIAEVEIALGVLASLPERRQGSFETLFRQVEVLVVLGQGKSDELPILHDFCMNRGVPSISGS
jgi:hypothetical protein